MDTTRVLLNLDRLHAAQTQANIALQQQGAAIRELARTQREIAAIQLETVKAIKKLDPGSDTQPKKSPSSSKLIASDVAQLAMAAGLLLYVVRGGDITPLLKALFGG